MTVDTAEIQFYMRNSEAFRRLLNEKHLPILEDAKDGVCSPPDGGPYLFAIEKRVEAIEFYVHEFTELVVKAIILRELEPLKNISNQDYYKFVFFGTNIAHCLSRETEGDKVW
jgi:hypothetical protein